MRTCSTVFLNVLPSQEQKTDAKNVKEKPGSDSGQKEAGKERPRRGRRSQSPKKSLSPEKSYSPSTENSQSSPVVKRRNKNSVKSSEKENQVQQAPVAVIEAYASPKKLRIPKQKLVQEGRAAKQNNDFTVDIFTSRTNEEREKERIENVTAEHPQEVEIGRKIRNNE